MILIDALYINDGGGKILLDYLITAIEENKIKALYVLDSRIKFIHPNINENEIIYLDANFLNRHNFYLKNKNTFTKVLCFGNLPPNIKLKATVYTYFHQPIYLNIPKEFSFMDRMKFNIKIEILKIIEKNTNYWIVQSNLIKNKFLNKFSINREIIKVLPFYPQFKVFEDELVRKKLTYLYVSIATPHKNHKRLINVFCQFFDRHRKGKLTLTINQDYQEVIKLINFKISKGYPIENIGFVERTELQKVYLSSEFLIFPSLTESFGLGLIEAIECGCKVIGADLPYTYEVCEPSIVFNPIDDESFLKAFEDSLNENIKISVPKIKNNINELINILQDNPCNEDDKYK